MAPQNHAVSRIHTGWHFGVMPFTTKYTTWNSAHSPPPTRKASGNTIAVVFFSTTTSGSVPMVPQMKPNRMLNAAATALNQMTSHKPCHTALPAVAFCFVQGPTIFMPTAMAKPENGSSAPNVPHSSTSW